jgi:hypothetical protein
VTEAPATALILQNANVIRARDDQTLFVDGRSVFER